MVWHEPAESRVLDEPADPQRGESKQMSDVDREVTVHAADFFFFHFRHLRRLIVIPIEQTAIVRHIGNDVIFFFFQPSPKMTMS